MKRWLMVGIVAATLTSGPVALAIQGDEPLGGTGSSTIHRGLSMKKPTIDEQRAIARYRKEVFPEREKEIIEAAGYPVTLDVNWSEIAVPGFRDFAGYKALFDYVYFRPVHDGLKRFTVDDIGIDALKRNVTTISFTNSTRKPTTDAAMFGASNHSGCSHALKNAVLIVDCSAYNPNTYAAAGRVANLLGWLSANLP